MSISVVQSNKVGSDTGVTSLNVTLGAGITQGNLVVASIKGGTNGMSFTYPDVSWQTAILNTGNATNTKTITIAYLIVDVSHAGQTSWTFQQNSSRSMVVTIAEYSSSLGWPASPVDQTATNNSTTSDTAISTGTTASTTQTEELWAGILTYSGASQSETGLTSGWTNRQEWTTVASTADVMYADRIVASTGAAQCSFNIGSPATNAGAVATFKDNATATGSATVGSSGGGITSTASLQIPGSASVGSSGGGLTAIGTSDPTGTATTGGSIGGLTATASLQIPGSASVGRSGGGLTVTGSLPPSPGSGPIWNKQYISSFGRGR